MKTTNLVCISGIVAPTNCKFNFPKKVGTVNLRTTSGYIPCVLLGDNVSKLANLLEQNEDYFLSIRFFGSIKNFAVGNKQVKKIAVQVEDMSIPVLVKKYVIKKADEKDNMLEEVEDEEIIEEERED